MTQDLSFWWHWHVQWCKYFMAMCVTNNLREKKKTFVREPFFHFAICTNYFEKCTHCFPDLRNAPTKQKNYYITDVFFTYCTTRFTHKPQTQVFMKQKAHAQLMPSWTFGAYTFMQSDVALLFLKSAAAAVLLLMNDSLHPAAGFSSDWQ